jgi:hypothetical protein
MGPLRRCPAGAAGLVLSLAGCGSDGARPERPSPPPISRCDASRCSAAPEAGTPVDAGPPDAAAASGDASDGGVTSKPEGGAAPGCCDPFVLRLARVEEQWPLILPGYESRSFSSYDRTGGNSDGFVGTHSFLYQSESGEYVVFDAYGPGVLDTLWFTGPDEGGANLDLGTVRFYLDGEAEPRLALPWDELFRGDRAPFLAPLVANNAVSTGGFVSFVPVPYAERLVVTTSKRSSFYQAHYETLPPDGAVRSFAADLDVEPARARFEAVLAPEPARGLVEVPLDVTLSVEGAADGAVIDVIRFVPAGAPTDAALAAARLRITWDDAVVPAVDAPLGAFFGAGLGAADVRSLPLTVTNGANGAFESRFLMPFFSRAHIEVQGMDGTLAVRQRTAEHARGELGYFHATHVEAHPTTPGAHFEWLDIEGAGTLAGTNLTVLPATPATKKWWEGDLHSSANGVRTPAIEGTGHEDDHLGGWSSTFLSRPFTLPLHGEPRADLIDRSGQYNANTTMYRFFPGIRFSSALRHGTEHGDRDGVSANYSGVAYYYLDPGGPRLVEADALDVSDAASRGAHAYSAAGEGDAAIVTSRFDGPWNDGELSRSVAYHTGTASFRLALPEDNSGCHLRRLYDQATGRQGARLRVDGAVVGVFYAAEENASRRFAERDFFLPRRHTRGKSSLDITVEPLSDSPPWSVAEYRLLCLTR